ncbi:MAG: hypothetical protein IT285_00010 [Bdellovibrionales bacterium]|nr:hypothetical protein [Bdellovibrionales bacterium]
MRSTSLVLALALIALPGCSSSPVAKVIAEDAPQYLSKAPATGDPELGRRLMGMTVETNACFVGVAKPQPFASWKERTLSYEGNVGAKLQKDFGPLLKAGAGVESVEKIEVTLGDIQEISLDKVYFDPASACAADESLRKDYAREGGREEKVVTRALRAGSIAITQAMGMQASFEVAAAAFGGGAARGPASASAGTANSTRSSWSGTQLYFAHRAEDMRVTQAGAPQCALSVGRGQSCDLAPCGAVVTSMSAKGKWGATVSCRDGFKANLKGTAGTWAGVHTGNGVSYGLRVTPGTQVGMATVDFERWTVVTAR